MNKELLTKFIEKKTGLNIKEISSVVLKDTDDEYGCIGEHYVVDCTTQSDNYFIGNDNEIETEIYNKKCLIRVDEYDRYLSSINSIIWLI